MSNRYAELPTGNSNWSSINTWKATTDGATGASVPISTDNVYVNADSCDTGATLTVNAAVNCLDMDWTGATNTPTLAGTWDINIYGNLTLIAAMNFTNTENLNFVANGTVKTITTNGLSLTTLASILIGLDSTTTDTWTIIGTLNLGSAQVVVRSGNLTLGTSTINSGAFRRSGTIYPLVVSPDSAVVNCTSFNFSNTTNLTWSANTATINVSGTGAFAGGSITTYNNINLNGTAHTITGNNTFAALNFKPAGAQTITATGTTQTFATMSRTGTGRISIVGGTWVKTGGGVLSFGHLTITDSTASPANTLYAGGGGINGGGNTNWGFIRVGVFHK